MAEETPESNPIPSARAVPAMRWRPNLVWLIPITALIIGAWLAAHTFLQHGPTITILFRNAEGIEAGKTRVKYKSVDIGIVQHMALSADHKQAQITVELDKNAGAFLAADTRFWVVRPRIAAGEISGLSTLFSGAYISVDLGKSANTSHDFVGLDVPPVVIADLPGRQFGLHAADMGSVDIGTPVYFRHVQAGEVIAYTLDPDGKGVTIKVFVHAPFDRYVTEHTRFWHASGIDISLDGSGLRIDTQSLTSVLLGGLAFEARPNEAADQRAEAGHVFDLQANRSQAMKRPDGESIAYLLYFPQSVRGLPIGAPVDFRGVVIGEVSDIGVDFDAKAISYRFPVEIHIYPERLRSHFRRQGERTAPIPDVHVVLEQMVKKGLRAQLRNDSLLTGQYFVAMDFFPAAPPVKLDWRQQPVALPTVLGGFDDLLLSLQSIARKLDQMPLTELGNDLHATLTTLQSTLAHVDQLVQHSDKELVPEARAMLEEARRTLQTAGQTLSADAPVQTDIRHTMQELSRAAQSLRALTDLLERDPQALLRGHGNPATTEEAKP